MYFKKFITAASLLISTLSAVAQIPKLNSNTTENEKLSSPIYKNLSNQFDLVIGYAEESYWWSNKIVYRLLGFKNGTCSKGSFYSKKKKNNSWTKPRIKFGQINKDSANAILRYLNDAGFFFLNRDTLNINRREINNGEYQVFTVSDGANYRFEILTRTTFTIIESYQPDYFLKVLPEFRSRETFIKCRDWFIANYNNL